MPRTVTVTFGDGETVQYQNVPDEVKPEEALARVSKDYPGRAVAQLDGGLGQDPVQKLANGVGYVKDLIRGAGVAGGEALDEFGPYIKGALGGGVSIGNQEKTNYADKVRSLLPTPDPATETPERKYTRAALEGAGGGAFAGPAGALFGAIGGLGSEAAASASSDDRFRRLLGGVVGSSGASLLTNPTLYKDMAYMLAHPIWGSRKMIYDALTMRLLKAPQHVVPGAMGAAGTLPTYPDQISPE